MTFYKICVIILKEMVNKLFERSAIMWSPVCDVFADDEQDTSSAEKKDQENIK